jgi:hypothetical protein
VVTRLYNNSGAVFSVLQVPCIGNIRESNSEARVVGIQKSTRSTRSTTESTRMRIEGVQRSCR